MDLVLRLGAVELEAERKVRSLVEPSERAVTDLLDAVADRGPETVAEVDRAVRFLAAHESRSSEHPSVALYISHPVRVSAMVAQIDGDAGTEVLQTAVLHNVTEVAGVGSEGLTSAGFGTWLADGVRRLTVDRARERDRSYLSVHYAAIEAHGDELALIKVVDRLDNILGLAPFEDEYVRGGYLDLTREFLVPIAGRLLPELGEYMDDAIEHARAVGFDPGLARLYRATVEAAE